MATTATSSAALLLCLCAASSFLTAAAAGAAVCHDKCQGHDAAADLVAKACAEVKGHEAHHYRGLGLAALTAEFCEAALRSDKRSAAANDTRGLAVVAMGLAGRAAAGAGAKARSSLWYAAAGSGSSRDTEYSLRYYALDYDTVALVVPACRAVVQEYSPGEFRAPFDYLECANRVMDAAGDCWHRVSYEGEGLKKVLWKDVVEVANRANLAQAMVEHMVDFPDDNEQ